MSIEKWCHNAKTGEIFSYKVSEDLTDFPRGILLAYDDYLTTGFKNFDEAVEWSKKYGRCDKCKSSRPVNENGKCLYCDGEVIFMPIKKL